MTPTPILIVEDDANIVGLLGAVFRRAGFAPTLLRHGREALECVAAFEPPAAVVLDVMLPYCDGFAVAEAIRANPRWKDVPIVMLTARTLAADVERARALGVAEYVMKPFQPQSLVSIIRALVGSRRR